LGLFVFAHGSIAEVFLMIPFPGVTFAACDSSHKGGEYRHPGASLAK
jgi:hypothetical protein